MATLKRTESLTRNGLRLVCVFALFCLLAIIGMTIHAAMTKGPISAGMTLFVNGTGGSVLVTGVYQLAKLTKGRSQQEV